MLPIILSYNPRSVLDLGCGNGRYCDALRTHIQDYTGADISNNFIRSLNSNNNNGRFEFIHSAAHEFVTSKKFDLILKIGLVTYMNDDEIKKMNLNSLKHLKENGIIIVRNVDHTNPKRSFFNDRWNILKYIFGKPTYQLIRRPESEFLSLFGNFDLVKKYTIPSTGGRIYIFKTNG